MSASDILAKDKPFAMLFDLRGAISTPSRRQKLHEWCAQREAALTKLLIVGAVVARSNIERGFVTAALWIRTPPWPLRVFADDEAAELWLLEQFAKLRRT